MKVGTVFIVSHPSGNTNVRAVLRAFQSQQMLSDFVTTIGSGTSDSHFTRFLPPSLRREVYRRSYPIPNNLLVRHPLREMTRILVSRYSNISVTTSLVEHESGWAAMDKVNRDIDQGTARLVRSRRNLTGVYCYEDCAEETFKAARERGLLCVYELPIAYSDTAELLLQQEAQRWPDWEQTLGGTRDSSDKRARKRRELEAADVVITPSDFVFRSLPEPIRSQKSCHIVPFGSPNAPNTAKAQNMYHRAADAPLRVLFVGTMTQRKGLADLFAAMRLLDSRKDIELICIGALAAPMKFYRSQYADFRYELTRPHAEVLELMQSCDILVLPSIVEGRALVQQEAMAYGLPLLITPNTGGEDLILDGDTGFIVPIRSPEAIAEKLCWFADHRLSLLPAMREHARVHAARYTWERYGETVASVCRSTNPLSKTSVKKAEYASLT